MGFFSVLALAEGAAVWARSSAHSTHTMHSISKQKKTRRVGLLQATLQTASPRISTALCMCAQWSAGGCSAYFFVAARFKYIVWAKTLRKSGPHRYGPPTIPISMLNWVEQFLKDPVTERSFCRELLCVRVSVCVVCACVGVCVCACVNMCVSLGLGTQLAVYANLCGALTRVSMRVVCA